MISKCTVHLPKKLASNLKIALIPEGILKPRQFGHSRTGDFILYFIF